MLIHPRVDQLTELRLRGMRDALEEQLQNPQSAELPFETWLACSGNERAVSFLGSIPHADIPAHVAAFDVALIADANFYVSPLKLFEYMAAERAIVAPAYDPITEVLTLEKNALLFEPKNFGAARECVERLAADPELRARLGRAARETTLDEYTWQHNAQRVIDACDQVIAARHR